MRYIGGKHRIAKRLAETILPYRQGRRLLEPFCGGLSATVALQPDEASDASEPLMKLIEAVRLGWTPPGEVTEEIYLSVKGTGSPLEAFCGLCCSFGGKWYGGYAREEGRNFALQGRNALLRKIDATRGVRFFHRSYEQINLFMGDVVYCDPPYAGTTNGYSTGPFESEAFWEWVKWAANSYGALVFVSEFSAPPWAVV